LGACQSEKLELELARSLCASGSITDMVRQLSTRVEKKAITVAGWATMPQPVRRPGKASLSRGEESKRRLLTKHAPGQLDADRPHHKPGGKSCVLTRLSLSHDHMRSKFWKLSFEQIGFVAGRT
jgi:hypothetical protein